MRSFTMGSREGAVSLARKMKTKSKRKFVDPRAERPAIPSDVKLDKATKEFIAATRKHGENLEPRSAEERAFLTYIEALIRYETAWTYWMSLSGKDTSLFESVEREVVRRQRVMFSTFDGWQGILKQVIHVPENEMRQIIYDALMANLEAMPDEYTKLSGLERGREFKNVADNLIALVKADRIKVTEQDMDASYCPACDEELSG